MLNLLFIWTNSFLGHCFEAYTGNPPRGLQLSLGTKQVENVMDTIVMANLGYLQLKSSPGRWLLKLREGRSDELYDIVSIDGKKETHSIIICFILLVYSFLTRSWPNLVLLSPNLSTPSKGKLKILFNTGLAAQQAHFRQKYDFRLSEMPLLSLYFLIVSHTVLPCAWKNRTKLIFYLLV